MREYDLAQEHMARKMKEAEAQRLIRTGQNKPSRTRRLLNIVQRNQPTVSTSDELTTPPLHQLTPSGTL